MSPAGQYCPLQARDSAALGFEFHSPVPHKSDLISKFKGVIKTKDPTAPDRDSPQKGERRGMEESREGGKVKEEGWLFS